MVAEGRAPVTAVGRLLRMLLVIAGADDVAAADDELADPDTVTNAPPGMRAGSLLAAAAPVDVEDFPKSLGNSVVIPINPGIGAVLNPGTV